MAMVALGKAVEQTNIRVGLPPIDGVRIVVAFTRRGADRTGQHVACVQVDLSREAINPLPIPSPEAVEAAVELLMQVDARMFAQRGRIVMPGASEMDGISRAAVVLVWEAIPSNLLRTRREFLLCLVDGQSLVTAHLESFGKFTLH